MILQGSRAERAANAIPNLDRQLRSHCMEMYHGDQEYEASRRERASLHAELQKAVRELIEMLVKKVFKK